VPAPTPKPPADPKAAQDASGRRRSAGDELLEECAALEEEVEELKAKYEMYFLGVELREPSKWREEVRKKVLRIRERFTRNTGLRFRVQSLHARYLAYERLWLRSAKEREEGTYRRDLEKARRRPGARPAAAGKKAAAGARAGAGRLESEDVDLSDLGPEPVPHEPSITPIPLSLTPDALPLTLPDAPGPAAAGPDARLPAAARPGPPAGAVPSPTAPKATPPEPLPAPARLGEAQLRQLYEAYVAAKKRCGEDASRITYEAVAASVTRQIPEIVRQHQARTVEFRVVVKDGKARLTAVPRK
jgi:hypothetical protein